MRVLLIAFQFSGVCETEADVIELKGGVSDLRRDDINYFEGPSPKRCA